MRFILFLICFFITSAPVAADDFLTWRRSFEAQAEAEGITPDTLKVAFQDINGPILKIIKLDRNQAEFKSSFHNYQKARLTPNIKPGKKQIETHRGLLNKVSEESGVPVEFIVALWGVETNFGKITGGFPVIHALATLAFEGRRRKFFERELIFALRILQEKHIDVKNMKGSWAGAMGQCQFMPSSFFAHAQDADGDGRKNIWTSHHDVFASIANYLKRVGWKKNDVWGEEVHLPDHMKKEEISEKTVKPVRDWLKMGVVPTEAKYSNLDQHASLVQVYDDKNSHKITFMVYDNFKNILKWNRSNLFALTVCQLADTFKK